MLSVDFNFSIFTKQLLTFCMRLLILILIAITYNSETSAFSPDRGVLRDTVKLSDSVFVFKWTSLIEGDRRDASYTMAHDKFGNLYIAGGTNSKTGVAYKAFDATVGTNGSAFIGKFSPNGDKIWVTYFGGGSG